MGNQEQPKIAVTPPGYDNIGAVLASMGEGFVYEDISSSDLCDPATLSRFEIVFINCSDECDTYAQEASQSLRRFVQQGGALYASDWAEVYIREAFPDYLTFSDEGGAEGVVTAQVADPGLREILGSSLELHFDLPSWRPIGHTSRHTRIYLRGSYDLEGGGWEEDKPLLVSFDYSQGHAIYTTFHNEPQLSEQERQLLRFLVLKPVTAKVARATTRLLTAERLSAEKETVASIDPGGTSPIYSHAVPHGVNLKIFLSWQGQQATLQLSVYAPDGQLYRQVNSCTSPVGAAVPNAQPGTWQYRVTGLAVPYANFPYVLTVATQPAVSYSHPGICPHCGLSNRPGANFCAGCGVRL